MIDAFNFTDGDRTYSCAIEERRGADGATRWWWFGVTGDGHRYAPFRAVADDTEFSVRYRVVSYYSDLAARRGLPYGGYSR